MWILFLQWCFMISLMWHCGIFDILSCCLTFGTKSHLDTKLLTFFTVFVDYFEMNIGSRMKIFKKLVIVIHPDLPQISENCSWAFSILIFVLILYLGIHFKINLSLTFQKESTYIVWDNFYIFCVYEIIKIF